MRKSPTNFWKYLLGIIVFFLFYQLLFAWNGEPENVEKSNLPTSKETIFVTIEEHHFGSKSPGFDSLKEKLEIWKVDKKEKEVWIKFDSLLPKDKTKAMVVYDRGYGSFEKYEEVFSVNTYPYTYSFKSNPFVTFHGEDQNGTMYLEFKGKRVKLKVDQIYYYWSVEGYQLVKTKIQNHGFYDKSDFKNFDEADKDKPSKEKDRKEK